LRINGESPDALLLIRSIKKSSGGVDRKPNGHGSDSCRERAAPITTENLYASNVFNSIFAFDIDQTSGALTQTANISTPSGQTVSNTAITITPSGSYLYAVNDVSAGINGYATSKAGTISDLWLSVSYPACGSAIVAGSRGHGDRPYRPFSLCRKWGGFQWDR
jgi:hypothetical protein